MNSRKTIYVINRRQDGEEGNVTIPIQKCKINRKSKKANIFSILNDDLSRSKIAIDNHINLRNEEGLSNIILLARKNDQPSKEKWNGMVNQIIDSYTTTYLADYMKTMERRANTQKRKFTEDNSENTIGTNNDIVGNDDRMEIDEEKPQDAMEISSEDEEEYDENKMLLQSLHTDIIPD